VEDVASHTSTNELGIFPIRTSIIKLNSMHLLLVPDIVTVCLLYCYLIDNRHSNGLPDSGAKLVVVFLLISGNATLTLALLLRGV
jgi:hypothetical protein